MSKSANLHANEETISQKPGVGILDAAGSSVPADGTSGYAKGCTFRNTSGSTVSTMLYVNIGTKSSCNFDPLTG